MGENFKQTSSCCHAPVWCNCWHFSCTCTTADPSANLANLPEEISSFLQKQDQNRYKYLRYWAPVIFTSSYVNDEVIYFRQQHIPDVWSGPCHKSTRLKVRTPKHGIHLAASARVKKIHVLLVYSYLKWIEARKVDVLLPKVHSHISWISMVTVNTLVT